MANAGGGKGSPYLVVVEPGHQEEFSVVVENGSYQVRDSRDQPLPRIAPPISLSEPRAAAEDGPALEHLVQYRNAWDLTNDVDSSTLGDKLAISVVRKASRAAGRISLHPGEDIEILHPQSVEPAPQRGPLLLRARLEHHSGSGPTATPRRPTPSWP